LARNKLPTLGPGIRQLKHLREIDVSGNRLTSLPSDLFTLPCLEVLTAATNRLSRLPTIEGTSHIGLHWRISYKLLKSDVRIRTRDSISFLYG
jgi:Leucine-rich repeat (LRR) protein